MAFQLPESPCSDEDWADAAAVLVANELLVGKVIATDQQSFAQRIIAQQLHILLISGFRPTNDPS